MLGAGLMRSCRSGAVGVPGIRGDAGRLVDADPRGASRWPATKAPPPRVFAMGRWPRKPPGIVVCGDVSARGPVGISRVDGLSNRDNGPRESESWDDADTGS